MNAKELLKILNEDWECTNCGEDGAGEEPFDCPNCGAEVGIVGF